MLPVALLFLQIVVPLIILAVLVTRPPKTRVAAMLAALLLGSGIPALDNVGDWTLLPWWIPRVLAVLSIPVLWRMFRHARGTPWWQPSAPDFARLTLVAVAAGGCLATLWVTSEGRRLPDVPAADLAFPLKGGTFAVSSGGTSDLLDFHIATSVDARFTAHPEYRTDLVRLNSVGMRADSLFAADPASHAIFGTTVVAPCEGVVTSAESTLPDLPVPAADPHHTLGNHIVLDCHGVVVTLAHLRQASVSVRQGQGVDTGTAIAAVGNSGDSDFPHLAVTAKRRGTALLLGGEAMPLRFDGRYLTRNQRHAN